MVVEFGSQAEAWRERTDGASAEGVGAAEASGPWARIANPRRVTLAEDVIEARPEGGGTADVGTGALTAHDRVRYPAA